MKIYIRALLILLLFSLTVSAFCETKTDEAHEKMKKAQSYQETDSDNSDGNDDDTDSNNSDNNDDTDNPIINEFSRIVFSALFNLDTSGKPLRFRSLQPVRYNPMPYHKNRSIGHRNTLSNHYYLLNLDTSCGFGISEETFNSITQLKIHFFGFSSNFKYRFLREKDAFEDIHYYSIMLERKSIALPQCDAGISFGFNDIAFGNDHYNGLCIGYNFELYPVNPVSIKFQADNLFYKNKNVLELMGEIRFHHKNYYFGVGCDYFDIDKTVFLTLLLHIGVML